MRSQERSRRGTITHSKVNKKFAPLPVSLVAQILPPWCLTILATVARPMPCPSVPTTSFFGVPFRVSSNDFHQQYTSALNRHSSTYPSDEKLLFASGYHDQCEPASKYDLLNVICYIWQITLYLMNFADDFSFTKISLLPSLLE
jgi:hypothetical protein